MSNNNNNINGKDLLAEMIGDYNANRAATPIDGTSRRAGGGGGPSTPTNASDAITAMMRLGYCPRCRAEGMGGKVDAMDEARSKLQVGDATNHYHTCARGKTPHISSFRASSQPAPRETFSARVKHTDEDGNVTGHSHYDAAAKRIVYAPATREQSANMDPVVGSGVDAATSRPSREGIGEWDTPGYSEQDAARINRDRDAARTAGFALRDEVYTRGELVNAVGVANARRKREEWLKLPPAAEGCAALEDIVKAEKRHDVKVEIEDMRMTPDGRIICPGWNDGLLIERDALAQVFQRISVECKVSSPGGAMVDWTRPRLVAGRVAVFNALCEQAGEDSDERVATHREMMKTPKHLRPEGFKTTLPKAPEMILRTRLDDGGQRGVYAGVSRKYGACDVDKVAAACREVAKGKDLRADIFYDRRRCKIDLLTHSNVTPEFCGVGEAFQAGIRLETDDTGRGGIRVAALLWRNLCRNYYVIDESVIRLASIRHIGDVKRIATEVQANLALAVSKIQHFLTAWDTGCQRKVIENVRAERGSEKLLTALLDDARRRQEADDLRDQLLAGTFRGLSERKLLPLGVRQLDDIMDDLIAAHDDERNAGAALVNGVPTLASLANAVSLYAHDYQSDRVQEIALERAAGDIMALRGSVPWVGVEAAASV